MALAAVLVVAAVGSGTALSSLLKLGFARPRPNLVPHAVEVYAAGFPSGHAMLSAVTYLTLGALLILVQPRRTVRVYILTLAVSTTLLVGASRVYLASTGRPTCWRTACPAPSSCRMRYRSAWLSSCP